MRLPLVVGAVSAALLAACGKNVCDRSGSFDLASKSGTCGTVAVSKVLGSGDTCTSAVKDCSDGERKTLEDLMTCYEALPVCASDAIGAWTTAELGCRAKALSVSATCRRSFFANVDLTTDGGTDGGVDAGVDAGRQPMTDGGGALTLIAVADESDFALAWSSSQPGPAELWELSTLTEDGGRLPVELLTPASLRAYIVRDAGLGVTRSFVLAGLEPDGGVCFGLVDAGTPRPDAGSADAGDAGGCVEPTDCPKERVCTAGVCKSVACNGPGACPAGYDCLGNPTVCTRTFEKDAGTPDAGPPDAGPGPLALPFLSPLASATTAPPRFAAADLPVTPFAGKDPEILAIDSARQVIAVEQDNQLFAYTTDSRGRRYDASRIDAVGTRARLAYQPSNDTLFACYDTFTPLGRGVRVRRSRDQGRTWGGPTEVADFVNPAPDDGGTGDVIRECDIATWRSGQVLVATVEGDNITVRTLTDNLIPGAADVAFAGERIYPQADGGLPGSGQSALFEPRHLALATLPSEFMVQVVFTANNWFNGSAKPPWTQSSDVWGVERDATTAGVFRPAERLTGALLGTTLPRDYPTVAIDPRSKRAVAAFTLRQSITNDTGATVLRDNVVISYRGLNSKQWATDTDLSVFARSSNKYLVMLERNAPLDPDWSAFSPAIAITPAGKIWVSYLAGPPGVSSRNQAVPYAVEFDLSKTNPLLTSPNPEKGWFVPPAIRIGAVQGQQSSDGQSDVRRGMMATSVDAQLSIYTVYSEASGPTAGEPGRPLVKARP